MIIFVNNDVGIKTFDVDSRERFQNQLDSFKESMVLGEKSASSLSRFIVIELFLGIELSYGWGNGALRKHRGLGLVVNQNSHEPIIFPGAHGDRVWIGFDDRLVLVSVDELVLEKEHSFDGLPFEQLIQISKFEMLLAFYETGVIGLSDEGLELWNFSHDIVLSFDVKANLLVLNFLEGDQVTLNVRTGRPI